MFLFKLKIIMENPNHKEKSRANRQRYFHLLIHLDLKRSRITLLTISIASLIDLLTNSNFVSQKGLERILYELKIQDRNRIIYLKDFDGQLERDSQGIPYWNVYLQTSSLITARCLAKALSKELFNTKNSIDPNLHLEVSSSFQQCKRENLFRITGSEFDPGHFSLTVLKFKKLLKNKQIQELIKENPDNYLSLIMNQK